ncbi:SDR family NAD(P)-dependent oxidoreductase [Methylohalobius crimeensis]|uniref:SDR family NAD(P)-dependent oxidoreductase n=1 Tax=Methylohalobius crimeensis TaxID=244365 RepID=UPI0003B716E1|nr:SDR family NAD(P)-dependent oxidoreductase [Methylohalobius crimeensis]
MSNPPVNTILITGCSSGIGYVTALGLKERGYQVFASARKPEDMERLKAEGFEAVQLDLDDSASIQAAVTEVLERTGGTLDALFNNGAWGQVGAVEDLSRDVLRAEFETNLFGTHELTNTVLPIMRRQGHGRILYNSSVLGLIALPYRGAYNASKFALEGLVDTLRLELSGTRIYPVLIEPGPILTKFRDNAYRKFKENIDPEPSPYREVYRKMEEKLTADGPVVPFTLPPEAVLQKVIYALESPRPKIRYYVTVPTYLFGFLKRVLPLRALDWVLRRV